MNSSIALGRPASALAIFAHPDDAELLSFGLLKRLSAAGVAVSILIVTDGSRGVSAGHQPPSDLPVIRMKETRAALAGITRDVQALALPDGKVIKDGDTVTAIEKVVLDRRPDLVVTHYLDPNGIDHQDHRAIAAAVRNICFRKPFVRTLLSCEPLQPYTDFVPNVFIDISACFAEKCEAIATHQSQNGRVYLSEEFHQTRCLRWAGLMAGEDGRRSLFEAYRLEKMVVL